ncbi:dienelactone hydrolase family protein [Salinibacterium sp. ZJ454]|uniref:dienelactone hydrolase family protein n=1 Tax=Salinibacterium sp. ZJ454 TaxID=2708339 RepID=UPI00142060E9|nr:dienelactone hydrolase family protein [Salinibacterium sp. ZJ454]
MVTLSQRDVEYRLGDTLMQGILVAPEGACELPTVVLLHDAFGLGADMIAIAEKIAALGFSVFGADVWGNRTTLKAQPEIGPYMGSMVGNRPEWIARVAEAHRTAAAQPEVDADSIVLLGYCFGGSSALEFVRTGGQVRGVIAIHPGLHILEFDWSAANAGTAALVSLGAIDPMATSEQRAQLERALNGADIHWELTLYSHTVHAFTSVKAQFSPKPELFNYHPRNAERAWNATTRFLGELFPQTSGA